MIHPDLQLVRQLNANSAPYRDPSGQLPWERLSADAMWLPRQALSLHGVAEFEALSPAHAVRLSHYEFIGFLRAGLWLEGLFMQRLSRCLSSTEGIADYAYLLNEIREEAGHSLMFLDLMEKSGLALPRLVGGQPWLADFLGRHAPLGGTLFWLAVNMGEEIPDKLNRYLRSCDEAELNPVIREMIRLHIVDEARHIAYARQRLEAALDKAGAAHKKLLAPAVRLLLRQFVRTFYLPGADLYELAGLTPGRRWRALAQANPVWREFVSTLIAPTLRLLEGHGFSVGEVM
ncbi:MAG: diiron oxygenase [Pseudomonadota bacterium]